MLKTPRFRQGGKPLFPEFPHRALNPPAFDHVIGGFAEGVSLRRKLEDDAVAESTEKLGRTVEVSGWVLVKPTDRRAAVRPSSEGIKHGLVTGRVQLERDSPA